MNKIQSTDVSEDCMYLLGYTRTPLDDDIYSPKLAYSMHLALSEDGNSYTALNHNSGLLFAKASVNENGALNAKSLKNPYLFTMADGTFGILAIRTGHDGEHDPESKGCVLIFRSSDFISYQEIGLIPLNSNTYVSDAICEYNRDLQQYEISWRDDSGNYYINTMPVITDLKSASEPEKAAVFSFESASTTIEGAVERNVIRVSGTIGYKAKTKLSPLTNTEIRVAESVTASSAGDLEQVRAESIYNDGSTAFKKVEWNTSHVKWDTAGTYEITGKVYQDSYSFPMAVNRADPSIIEWHGQYYFIATNDDTSIKSGFSVRTSESIPGLASAGESLILGNGSCPSLNGIFWWAPEFHIVGDQLYVFFAGSSGEFGDIHSHVMKLKPGGNPAAANDWEMPVRMQKKDGNHLFESGITLDMTYFEADGKHFVMWAQRQFSPEDLGSWLYIANIDPQKPWKLINDPVLISKPEYGWANNHTFVDEGPFAIFAKDHIYVTFSSALVNATYCVGILTAQRGMDLMNADNWTKGNYPLLTSRSVPGEFGPGHNSYVMDADDNLLSVYHARDGVTGPRSTGIRRVHFDIDGYPVLDLTEEDDLNKDLITVTTKVIVTNDAE